MARNSGKSTTTFLDKIVSAAVKGGKKGAVKGRADFARFARLYFHHVPPQDIANRSPVELAACALGHWRFAADRKPGQPKIRAFTPDAKRDGWSSPQSVIEVINDNMPFLVDSIIAELNRLGLTAHLVIHPVIALRRDGRGRLLGLATAKDAISESFIQCWITRQPDDRLKEIESALADVLNEVRAAVEDWHTMQERLATVIEELRKPPKNIAPEECDEARDFLRWVHDDHFTFLGYRDYDIAIGSRELDVAVKPKAGLGVLRSAGRRVFNGLRDIAKQPKEVRDFIRRPELMMVTKSNLRSVIHRPVVMDAIGVKRFNAAGEVIGQRLFIGLFTSSAYSRSPRDIPILRRKIQQVLQRAGFPPSGHAGKTLINILETYPRDELLQISESDLYRASMGISHLQDRQRLALFLRRDDFERFISCLVYIPRESYTTALRQRFQDILASAVGGQVASHSAELGDMPLARLHLLIQTTPGKVPPYDERALEAQLAEEARTWPDRISEAAIEAYGEERGEQLADCYAGAFPVAYQERFTARDTLFDIKVMESLSKNNDLAIDLYRPDDMPRNELRFKMYQVDREAALSDVLPVLEHMGLRVADEIPFDICPKGAGGVQVMIHDFGLETRDKTDVVLHDVADKFKATFERVWAGSVESDGFNALVLKAGLGWREVVVLRAYSKYLRQISLPFSQTYMEETLARNAELARLLIDLFIARFDPARPGKGRDAKVNRIHGKIISGLDAVISADEDRIIRAFLNLFDATLRTNYFQKDAAGEDKPSVSFKLESRKIDDVPLPRPLREIFVYSPRVEGIHLRFGFVARGGLRWSDRREDFRTEILGLAKAQQVKNAVIVPVGSKGGFVVKQPPADGDRDAVLQEGIACYKTFISGLLDVTDNYQGTKVIPPKDVVRRDDDDPYLVVAADKGTATFSDIANGVSKAYGFWLGDAFASGGSVGYDHKKMGITARGAWECVERHFREMGINTRQQEFTVVGVGDMSGDVFGNGMLLSPHIKLVAAFNHLHIFLDPDPDPAKSFAERARLFALPRSGWNDYNTQLISKGGAIYERSAKSIALTPQIRARFEITQTALSPNELLRILLKAQVDLLWFGGIGTYIKASTENNADAGDRANDGLRINGAEVRARVLGEGANLGITQPGRIECGLQGVRLNQDSIDNSAGVDCSDHEVNIKILIDSLVSAGRLTEKQRVGLLAQMTDEVAHLCLADNYLQSQAISISQHQGCAALDNHIRLMRMLERGGDLDRAVEFLPDDETLAERLQQGKGLSRPEIGVLLSYSKNWLYAQLLLSALPDDPALEIDLVEYFPSVLGKRYNDAIDRHRLRREIIATVVTNTLVNRVGETFVTEMQERTGMAAAQIVRAFSIARNVFAMDDLWSAIEGLDNKVPAGVQIDMMIEINNLLDWITLWFLRNGVAGLAIGDHSERFRPGIGEIMEKLDQALPDHYLRDRETRAQRYIAEGVPKAIALRTAGLVNLFSACDLVVLAAARKLPVTVVAKIYFAIGTRFRLGSLRASAEGLKSDTHWQKMAISALIEETYGHQIALTTLVLDAMTGKMTPAKAIEQWIDRNQGEVEQTDRLLADLWSSAINDLSMVAVASRQLRALTAGATAR